MSKRSRKADNSKRQQPVQQQRAQAAQQSGQKKNRGESGKGDLPSTQRSDPADR